jgi:hypothetical protein
MQKSEYATKRRENRAVSSINALSAGKPLRYVPRELLQLQCGQKRTRQKANRMANQAEEVEGAKVREGAKEMENAEE